MTLVIRPGHFLASLYDSTVVRALCWSCHRPMILQGEIAGVQPTVSVVECPACYARGEVVASIRPLSVPVSAKAVEKGAE